MKKNIFLPAFLLSLLTFGYAHAESIVMKSTVYGLEALSDEDIQTHGQVVSDILLKYCWPMCQDSDLTPEEQHELLSPEGNEERFLEKKLNETVPASERDFEFAVVFVPTTLYELFCISEIQKNTKLTSFLPKDICFIDENKMKNIELLPFPIIFAEPVSTKLNIDKLSNLIKEFNQQFYQQEAQNDSKKFSILTSYRLFIKELSSLPLFQVHDSIFLNHKTLSKFIKKNVSKLIEILAHDIFPYDDSFQYRIDTLGKNSLINSKVILRNYIECEYKAHEANQGLISRGSKQSPIHKTIASTLENKGEKVDSDDKFNSYSISFGKSLLAGFINAFKGGCVLYYVTEESCIGFCLYINKEQYFQNKINKLFFIQSFSSLTNLCAAAEHFHPRCITAVKDSSQPTKIRGLRNFILTGTLDEAQILTVERDSLEHELKFSKYFIDNLEIFYIPVEQKEMLTSKEKQAEILHAQCQAFIKTYALIKKRQEQLARARAKARKALIKHVENIIKNISVEKARKVIIKHVENTIKNTSVENDAQNIFVILSILKSENPEKQLLESMNLNLLDPNEKAGDSSMLKLFAIFGNKKCLQILLDRGAILDASILNDLENHYVSEHDELLLQLDKISGKQVAKNYVVLKNAKNNLKFLNTALKKQAVKEAPEQLARVLDAIAEVAAKEKDQKNENFGALLASTPETADLVAEDRAQQRIATLARHLAPADQDLTSAKL